MPNSPNGSYLEVRWAIMWEIAPNPGRIRMYTSGCPKNQKRCWYRTGSPPPPGSKKDVLRLRSVRSIVIPPARTGRDRRSSSTVNPTAHTKRGMRSRVIPSERMLMIVLIKLIAPRIEEAPAMWREKMAKSTDGPEWAMLLESGG